MPKAKFEGICRSIKQKIEAQDYPYQSLLPAESEADPGVRLRPQHPAPGPGGPDRRRLPAAHPGQGGAGDLPAGGQDRLLIGVIESFQETDQRNNLHAVTQGGAVRAGGDRRAPGLPERVHGGRAPVGRRAGALPGGQGPDFGRELFFPGDGPPA